MLFAFLIVSATAIAPYWIQGNILAMINPSVRHEAAEALDRALDEAVLKYRSKPSVKANEDEISEAKERLVILKASKAKLEDEIDAADGLAALSDTEGTLSLGDYLESH